MTFLITRPEHDDTTFYISEWSKELINIAKNKGIKVLECNKERANKNEVESLIRKQAPRLVMFNGHGSSKSVMGHNNEVLIEQNKNEDLLNNRIVYTRACNCAKELGKSCVKEGTDVFIGYEEEFGFWISNIYSANPLRDKLAKPFFESSNQVIKTLLNGRTAEEAFQQSQQTYDKWLEKLQRSDAPPEAQYIARVLFWNKINQKLLGNKKSRI